MAPIPEERLLRMEQEALAHYHAKRVREAELLYREILTADRNRPASLGMLGVIGLVYQQWPEAEKLLRRSVELAPTDAGMLNNLGIALRQQGRITEAVDCYRRAARIEPDNMPILITLAGGLQDTGNSLEAMELFERVTSMQPSYVEGHVALAKLYLRRGDFLRGWQEYEWRWSLEMFLRQHQRFSKPKWNGESEMGKTVLIHAEQGLGDTINFIRYVPLVVERVGPGSKVVVMCQPALRALLEKATPGVSAWVSAGESIPEHDVQRGLLSLPLIFRTEAKTIPPMPRLLEPAPEIVDRWRSEVVPEGLRVGLCWAGNPGHMNDVNRSMNVNWLMKLDGISGVSFYSLQKELRPGDAQAPRPGGAKFFDLTPQLTDFSQTAGLIANLDLVITVDTSVAHLAAAMGKPTWVLLPLAPDWRYGDSGDACPWYPAMRLFRQRAYGDWGDVMTRVRAALEELVAKPG